MVTRSEVSESGFGQELVSFCLEGIHFQLGPPLRSFVSSPCFSCLHLEFRKRTVPPFETRGKDPLFLR